MYRRYMKELKKELRHTRMDCKDFLYDAEATLHDYCETNQPACYGDLVAEFGTPAKMAEEFVTTELCEHYAFYVKGNQARFRANVAVLALALLFALPIFTTRSQTTPAKNGLCVFTNAFSSEPAEFSITIYHEATGDSLTLP